MPMGYARVRFSEVGKRPERFFRDKFAPAKRSGRSSAPF